MEEKKFKSILAEPEVTLEYVYDQNKLDFDSLKKNPILKPISEINETYSNLHLTIIKAVLEYEEEYKKLQELEGINPRYTNTILMVTIKNMVTIIKTIIHSQDLQINNMRRAISEMIDINGSKFKLILDTEEEMKARLRKEMDEEHSQQKKETLSRGQSDVQQEASVTSSDNPIGKTSAGTEFEETMSGLKKIVGGEEINEKSEEGVEEKKEVKSKIYSSLLERVL